MTGEGGLCEEKLQFDRKKRCLCGVDGDKRHESLSAQLRRDAPIE